ncbi:MAG TPA: 1-deoxy-D-xylulose-5-phosphate synthase N-terminal domain-containing protein [Myxococcota bacterium]|nr:1-deoxy-D-xylulose-5-phosphate synthase N-terminal domain-containing protein [Myxococcota bacterium]HQK49603.1 1-deoxy-D-xylulose-5-phosphate synthase N-terminal domain-containing protein [Myxococcota bacterium]
MLDSKERKRLKDKARELRERIVEVTFACGGAHVGGAFSQHEILVALYYKVLRIDPKRPDWEDRDRFILSKGHGGIGHAVILGDLGYFDPALLKDFNKTGSPFGMHLDRLKVPGVDFSTGSLGHGLGLGVGAALGARVAGKDWRTYVVLSDGECAEGSTWEAAMAAGNFRVTNLTAFVDRNRLSLDGETEKIMRLEPLEAKFEAFGWRALRIDGHDFDQILEAVETSKAETERPVVVIADTIKGKGVDYMENQIAWHYGGLDEEMKEKAIQAIRRSK